MKYLIMQSIIKYLAIAIAVYPARVLTILVVRRVGVDGHIQLSPGQSLVQRQHIICSGFEVAGCIIRFRDKAVVACSTLQRGQQF